MNKLLAVAAFAVLISSGGAFAQTIEVSKAEARTSSKGSDPSGVKHWHGASADTGMSHIALRESTDGKVVDWLEPVSDEQYRK